MKTHLTLSLLAGLSAISPVPLFAQTFSRVLPPGTSMPVIKPALPTAPGSLLQGAALRIETPALSGPPSVQVAVPAAHAAAFSARVAAPAASPASFATNPAPASQPLSLIPSGEPLMASPAQTEASAEAAPSVDAAGGALGALQESGRSQQSGPQVFDGAGKKRDDTPEVSAGGPGISSFADLVELNPASVRVTLPLLSGLGKPSFTFDIRVDRISKDRGVEGPVVGKFYYGHEHVYVHLTQSQTGGISLRFIVPMGYGNGDGYERTDIPVTVDVLSKKVDTKSIPTSKDGAGISPFAALAERKPASARVTFRLLPGLGKPSFSFDMKVDRISKGRGIEGPVIGKFYYGHGHVYAHLTESETGDIELRFIVPMGYGNGDGYERRHIPVQVEALP
jgi:hypothetical protein